MLINLLKLLAHNGLVGGSSPSGPTSVFKHLRLRKLFTAFFTQRKTQQYEAGTLDPESMWGGPE